MRRKTEALAEHTWLKIGGSAKITIPESKRELVDLLREYQASEEEYRILGNGSNLLVSDDGVNEPVIKVTEACSDIQIEDGIVTAGASVMIPQFVRTLIKHDLGGYEFLYSVPGTIGGAIYMNAGRGKSYQKTIANHLLCVEYFDGNKIKRKQKSDLKLSHRSSIFHEHPDWVILSATFNPPEQPEEVGQRKAKKRMEKVGQRNRSKPNAGSVFKSRTRLPLHRILGEGLSIGDARFVSSNRIINDGNASFMDVFLVLKIAQFLNWIIPPFNRPEIEWNIWSD